MRVSKTQPDRKQPQPQAEPFRGNLRPNRGLITSSDLGIFIEFQFNPEEMRETKTLNWNRELVYGLNEPLTSFSCGGSRELEFEILLDSHFSKFDVGQALDMLDDLVIPYNIAAQRTTGVPVFGTPKTSGSPLWGMPPICKLTYGGKTRTVVFTQKTVREVMHATTEETHASRSPTRAIVALKCIVIENMRSLVDLRATGLARGART